MIAAILFISFYFLPTVVGISNKKRNQTAIFILNLFAGWTLIGWIVALVWATCKDDNRRREYR